MARAEAVVDQAPAIAWCAKMAGWSVGVPVVDQVLIFIIALVIVLFAGLKISGSASVKISARLLMLFSLSVEVAKRHAQDDDPAQAPPTVAPSASQQQIPPTSDSSARQLSATTAPLALPAPDAVRRRRRTARGPSSSSRQPCTPRRAPMRVQSSRALRVRTRRCSRAPGATAGTHRTCGLPWPRMPGRSCLTAPRHIGGTRCES